MSFDDSSRDSVATCSTHSETIVLSSDSSGSPQSECDVRPNSKRQRVSKKRRDDIDSDDSAVLERALSAMKSDDFDIFGQFVASEIRQMKDQIRQNAVKREISKILFNSID